MYVVVLSWHASSDAGTNVGHWVWVNNNNHGGHVVGGGLGMQIDAGTKLMVIVGSGTNSHVGACGGRMV